MRHLRNAIPALLLAAGAAQAHQIWIEQPAGQSAVIRFGEFSHNLREVSPGLLDKLAKPTATLISASGEKPADASKVATGFALPFQAANGDSIVAEDAHYPLVTRKQGDKETRRWYYPSARLVTSLAAQAPKLTLDIVPTGKPGQFKVVYKDEPLSRAKVELVVQSGWSRAGRSDDRGIVQFDMPWQGTYVAEVMHVDQTGGQRQGEAYDVVSYVTTLSYVKPDGVAAIPAGPAAPPNN